MRFKAPPLYRFTSEGRRPVMPAPNFSDRDLLAQVRKGGRDAYGVLWERHAASIRRSARYFTGFDPDDVTAETFARVLRAIERGNGPVDAFRPYAMAAARNIAAEWARARPETSLDAVGDIEDGTLADFASTAADDRSLAGTAFAGLPARWQEVLWYSEVEGMQPAEIAPLLGLSANSVAALAVRAREGLRQGWVQAHMRAATVSEAHTWVLERGPRYIRGKLGAKAGERITAHLEGCPDCAGAYAEMRQANTQLAGILIPLVLGGGAASAWLRSAHSDPASARLDGSANASAVRRRSRRVAVVGVAAVIVFAGGAVAVAVAPHLHHRSTPPSDLSSHPSAHAAPIAPPSASSSPQPPTATPGSSPTSQPAAESEAPQQSGATSSAGNGTRESDSAKPDGADAIPTAPGHTVAPPAQVPPVSVPVTVTAQQPAPYVQPAFTGSTQPHAVVRLEAIDMNSGGVTRWTATAAGDGSWSSSGPFTATGQFRVSAISSSGTRADTTVSLTNPLRVSVTPTETGRYLTIVGVPGAQVQLLPAGTSLNTLTLNADGVAAQRVAAGTTAVRYIAGGQAGLSIIL